MVLKEDNIDTVCNDILNDELGANIRNAFTKDSPCELKQLRQYKELSLPKEIEETDNINCDGNPHLILRDEIFPIDNGETYQCRSGKFINNTYASTLSEGIQSSWNYGKYLPILEKMKKPIKRPDGKGYYRYRVVEGRHRYWVTPDYKYFPCYIVEGHEADIQLLSQKLNNPIISEQKLDNTEDDVKRTIKEQVEWYKKTDGKKGVKATNKEVQKYLTKHFPHIRQTSRKKFADECLSSSGIHADIMDYNKADITKILTEYHADRTNLNKKDSKGRVGIHLKVGRNQEEFSSLIDVAQSIIKCAEEDPDNIPKHYLVAAVSIGEGAREVTTENLGDIRKETEGIFFRKFMKDIVLPLAKLNDDDKVQEPKILWVAQNNAKKEKKEQLY